MKLKREEANKAREIETVQIMKLKTEKADKAREIETVHQARPTLKLLPLWIPENQHCLEILPINESLLSKKQ